MNGLDDLTGKQPTTCKATPQPEFSPAASRKPSSCSTNLRWRRDGAKSAFSPFSRRSAPPVLAIGGYRLHKSFCRGTEGSNPSPSRGESAANLTSAGQASRHLVGGRQAMDRAGEFIEGVAPQAKQVASNLYDQGSRSGAYVRQYAAQEPFTVMLVAGAIGFALGYLIRGR